MLGAVILSAATGYGGYLYGKQSQTDVENDNSSLEQLREQLKSVNKQLEDTRKTLESKTAEVATLNNKIAELTATKTTLETRIRSLETQIEGLNTTIAEKDREISSLNERINELQGQGQGNQQSGDGWTYDHRQLNDIKSEIGQDHKLYILPTDVNTNLAFKLKEENESWTPKLEASEFTFDETKKISTLINSAENWGLMIDLKNRTEGDNQYRLPTTKNIVLDAFRKANSDSTISGFRISTAEYGYNALDMSINAQKPFVDFIKEKVLKASDSDSFTIFKGSLINLALNYGQIVYSGNDVGADTNLNTRAIVFVIANERTKKYTVFSFRGLGTHDLNTMVVLNNRTLYPFNE